jgi:hypothetical protein
MSTDRYTTITVPYIISHDALWSRVFGACPEGFGSWWRRLEFLDDTTWETAGIARVWLEDPEDEDKTVQADIRAEAIALTLSDLTFPDHLRQEILYDNADSISADAVIQHIVYGEIVFG